MSWVTLIAAGLLEIAWSSALKRAEGMRRPGWAITGIVLAVISLCLLSLALRELPMGTAYAVWVGVGATGIALTGIIAFHDPATLGRFISIAAIVAGIVGLKLFGG